MLAVRRAKPSRKRVSRSTSLQAPTGGLNARDALAAMKPTEAITLENFWPTPSSIDVRNGRVSHATGLPDLVETLAFYNTGSDSKLFAVSDDSIFDVTTSGAVGTAEVSGLTNARFQYINLGTAGGFFLLMVNGEDKLQGYDGSSWWEDGDGTHDITGLDTADCIHINNFKNRVWLIEKDSFHAWYLAVISIGGAAAKLDLSGLFRLGGYLMAMANWTIDNASGIDDYAAFITSEGEVALYKGTDPSSSTTWALVGTFRMGRPIGRRCFCKAGADVLVVTTDGAFPLSKAMLTDRAQKSLAASDKIVNIFNADVLSYKSNYGWQPLIHPIGQKLIINVPQIEGGAAHQYVMNTDTKAWTKFTGWNAVCFESFGDDLYYGGDTVVFKADTGNDDDGSDIVAICQQAYNYFGSPGEVKHFKMVRPVITSDAVNIKPSVILNVDYAQAWTPSNGSYSAAPGSEWDVAPWNTSSWVSGMAVTQEWLGVDGVGYAGSLRMAISCRGFSASWQSTDYVYEPGQVLS